jgi:hypothetical protein
MLVRQSFASFTSWLKQHPFRRPLSLTRGLLPGDFAATIAKDGIRVGVIGLNSSFLQLKDGDYEGKLGVDARQLVAVCGENFTDWFDQCTFCLFMTHHPPSWFSSFSREALKQDIAVPGRFVAHLCGHLHDSAHERVSVGGDGVPSRCWQGASLFGLEFYGIEQKSERKHGYSAATVNIVGGTGALRIWPRLAVKHEAGNWRFVQSPALTLEGDGGTAPEVVTTSFRVETKTPTRSKYRILLLGTELDLGKTKKLIGDHLERSLGVIVIDPAAVNTAEPNDLAILMQGWRWEQGENAKIWQS